jgi:hypothetical protein
VCICEFRLIRKRLVEWVCLRSLSVQFGDGLDFCHGVWLSKCNVPQLISPLSLFWCCWFVRRILFLFFVWFVRSNIFRTSYMWFGKFLIFRVAYFYISPETFVSSSLYCLTIVAAWISCLFFYLRMNTVCLPLSVTRFKKTLYSPMTRTPTINEFSIYCLIPVLYFLDHSGVNESHTKVYLQLIEKWNCSAIYSMAQHILFLYWV